MVYTTPIDGLRFMFSVYHTDVQVLATDATVPEGKGIVSLDLVRNGWDVKSEFGHHTLMGVSSEAYYVQVGKTLWRKWMPFARYDHVVLDTRFEDNDSYKQGIVVVGLNCQLNSNIAVRVENHFNRGYALPVASGEVPVNGGIRDWNLLVAGVHFIF